MGLFEILLLIAVGFVGWKLYSVLGKDIGEGRHHHDYHTGGNHSVNKPAENIGGGVADYPEYGSNEHILSETNQPVWEGYAEKGSELALELERIAQVDKFFSVSSFIDGAKAAYEMIIDAFAKPDRKTLKILLSSEVLEGFNRVIDERERKGEAVESSFIGLDEVSVIDAGLNSGKISLTVKFISQIITATRDKDGNIISGDDKKITKVTDIWTFMRNISSKDPNWKLVATE